MISDHPNTLLACLLSRAHDDLLIAPDTRVSVGRFCEEAQELRNTLEHFRGSRVAIFCQDSIIALRAVCALHGFAESMLLIPRDSTPAMSEAWIQAATIDMVYTDRGVSVTDLSKIIAATSTSNSNMEQSEIDSALVIPTSGTTGSPKLVPHTLTRLAASVKKDASTGAQLCWGLTYDPFRFAGLQVVLQAWLGGSPLAIAPIGHDLRQTLDFFAESGVNAISATPSMWRKILMLGSASKIKLKIATMGGEIADQKVIDAVLTQFPSARVRHVYASSEAGVGFSVSDDLEGFPSSWLQTPPRGVEIRVRNDVLQLRSPRTVSDYLDGVKIQDHEGWVSTGDKVHDDGQRVRFVGRINGTINVGGNKIAPEVVESVLLTHPAVFSASVTGKPSAFTGTIIEAHVVLSSEDHDQKEVREQLIQVCKARLPRYAVPAIFRFVSDIALGHSGKKARR